MPLPTPADYAALFAPLAETLHGEREGYVATSGASRREPA